MIFLRFPNEATFLAAAAPYTSDEGINIPNLDIIGTIYTDEEDNPQPLPGYHVNMLGPVPQEFRPFVIRRPKHPIRVFAGY